jgi:hypothetical protein
LPEVSRQIRQLTARLPWPPLAPASRYSLVLHVEAGMKMPTAACPRSARSKALRYIRSTRQPPRPQAPGPPLPIRRPAQRLRHVPGLLPRTGKMSLRSARPQAVFSSRFPCAQRGPRHSEIAAAPRCGFSQSRPIQEVPRFKKPAASFRARAPKFLR